MMNIVLIYKNHEIDGNIYSYLDEVAYGEIQSDKTCNILFDTYKGKSLKPFSLNEAYYKNTFKQDEEYSLDHLNEIKEDLVKNKQEVFLVHKSAAGVFMMPIFDEELHDEIIKKIKNKKELGNNSCTNLKDNQSISDKEEVEEIDVDDIYKKTTDIVYGQDEQIKIILANIIANKYASSKFDDVDKVADMKKNILLIGNTGIGKTLTIKTLAKYLNIPYVIVDATEYTSRGYRGEDVYLMLYNLYLKCDKDLDKAQNGIIFIDEVDKICKIKKAEGAHVTTTDVQEELLKILEGSIVNRRMHQGIQEVDFSFDTRKLTFVLSGVFEGLIDENLIVDDNILNKYGMIKDFAARLSPIVIMNNPSEEDLKMQMISSNRSYLKLLCEYFSCYGVSVDYNDAFIDYIAHLAYSYNDGYRGIKKAIDNSVGVNLYDVVSGKLENITFDGEKVITRVKK